MKRFIDEDETGFSLSLEDRGRGPIDLTEAEWADYNRVVDEFDAWQERLYDAYKAHYMAHRVMDEEPGRINDGWGL
jgi:hypothetical protein